MKKLKKIVVLGSGALKIGEAGEFDYSGTQAIKALKEEGCQVILVNPNIATIQTSEGLADEVYFVPVTAEFVTKVIEREKPDGIMIAFGGQTALNCGMELERLGILKKHRITVLGSPIQAIIDTEDRERFADTLQKKGFQTAQGKIVFSVKEGLQYAQQLTYPVMLRAGFALGGTGSGVAKDPAALEELLTKALANTSQVIVEESLSGWKELEYEVVRDKAGNSIVVCNMENMDPVGIHTGESIVVAPSQTLTNDEYYGLRNIAIEVINHFEIVGECNIQFALKPVTQKQLASGQPFEYRIIEVNARLSRSSALASKATGYPLAYIAAKLSLGKTLPELHNAVTGKTSAFFEPALDYLVVKIPRWDLDKYEKAYTQIGSEMKSVGEVMSIGRTFEEAIQKGARMLNDGYEGVIDPQFSEMSSTKALVALAQPSTTRLFSICSALLAGVSIKKIAKITGVDVWFIAKLANVVTAYSQLKAQPRLNATRLLEAKKLGFSDKQLAKITKSIEPKIRSQRLKLGITPCVKRIDTMAGEFPAQTNYLYMTYHGLQSDHVPNNDEPKAMVIGAGPYSIGTSVEFDWCAVSTLQQLKKRGISGVMVNCNPETVSTDYDESAYLYFEELSFERIQDIYAIEQAPCIVSVGGQIPNSLVPKLASAAIPILGTAADDIQMAESRQAFSALLDTLQIKQPKWAKVSTTQQALKTAEKLRYPLLVRPSFVLSGKAMRVIESESDLEHYLDRLALDLREHPLVMSQFFRGAKECDIDGVAQDGKIKVMAVSEHIEPAGVHSGDSSLMFPSVSLSSIAAEAIKQQAHRIISTLKVNGPFNLQFLVQDDEPYVIECNLRASRSVPFVSKVSGINFIALATDVLLGKKITARSTEGIAFQAVKVPQFSFHKLRGADPVLRVEMSSTGEVASFGKNLAESYLKSILATGISYPTKKAVLVSLGGKQGKLRFLKSCDRLVKMGYTLYATHGTGFFLRENNLPFVSIEKMHAHAKVTAADLFTNRKIDFAVVVPGRRSNTFSDKALKTASDGYKMRRLAVDSTIPIFVNVEAASTFVDSLYEYRDRALEILPRSAYV